MCFTLIANVQRYNKEKITAFEIYLDSKNPISLRSLHVGTFCSCHFGNAKFT